ncbi:MAG TPA: nucleotide exchange factor GrpE [Bauldia sp.]|nr:nucleotide exchange factor GrpE [Bauldia sp.]
MADETTPENPQTANTAEAPATPQTPQTPDPGPSATFAAEVADMKDKLLRTLAEMENLRRRTEREMADARTYAVASFARDMLTVGDNLRRAIDAVPKEQRDGRDPALSTLIEGVEMTERSMEQSMAKFGVRRVDTAGVKFDPQVHQAMFEVESPEAQPGTVVQEVQAGYVIGDRVLRPALVGIAKRPKPTVVSAGESHEKVAAAPEGPES